MQQFTNYKLFFVVSASNNMVTSDRVNIPDVSENFAAMALFLHIMGKYSGWRSISIQRANDEPGAIYLIKAERFQPK